MTRDGSEPDRSPAPVVDKRARLASLASAPRVVLEFGCGSHKKHPDAIGIDALDYDAVDVVGDVYDVLARIPDAAVDAAYSYHFVEHLPDLARFVLALRRVVKPGGYVVTVAPHFSNPYFYSDYTHRTAFGLYSFSYLADDHLHRRQVPRYVSETGFELSRVRLCFKAARPFYVAHALRRVVQGIVNVSAFTRELYERNFAYLLPCYEVEYTIRRV